MPELPEVESARAVVERSGLDRRIVAVDDADTYECRPHAPGEIADALLGRTLTRVHRRGKLMWCETSGTDADPGPGALLSLHLGMSGRILISTGSVQDAGGDYEGSGGRPREPQEKWFRFTLGFADGGRLRLLDPRRLGRVRLDPDLDALGQDAGEIGRQEFRDVIGAGRAPVKARLLDQSKIAGVGNLLADQVLWQARISPQRRTGDLGEADLDRLRRELRSGIRSAIANGGVHTGEVVPHRRAGEHCPRCGAEMTRATVGGRTTWWCPVEQD